MTLDTQLQSAFRAEPALGVDDLRRRVGRRRSRRRVTRWGTAVVLVLASVLGVRALLAEDEPSRVIAGPAEPERAALALTPEDLGSATWIADETTGPTAAWLRFDTDEQWRAATECGTLGGSWEVRDGVLHLEEGGLTRDVGCTTRYALGGAGEIVEGDTLRFAGREGAVVDLHRTDRIATVATADDLTASWRTPDSEQSWVFEPGDLSINGCSTGAWRIRDGELQVQRPGPDCAGLRADRQAYAQAQFWLDDGVLVPYLVRGQLYLVSTTTTVRLVPAEGAVVPEDLSRSAWVATEVDGLDTVPRLAFRDDGTVVLTGTCAGWTGTWDLDDGQVSLATLQAEETCPAGEETAADLLVQDVVGDTGPGLLDGTLTFVTSDATVRFERLDDLPAPTEDELIGSWETPDGSDAVTFQAAGGLDSVRYFCRGGTWQLHLSTLRVLDRGRNCTFPSTGPTSALLQVGAFVDVRLDRGRLLLTDDLNPTVTAVLVPSIRPGPNAAETLMLDAIAALGAEQCCAEPAHGGSGATVGFVWDGAEIWGGAGRADGVTPIDGEALANGAVLAEDDDGTLVQFRCGDMVVTLREHTVYADLPTATIEAAADAFIAVLPCEAEPP